MPVKDTTRDAAFNAIARHQQSIADVARAIHADPEVSFDEHRAMERLSTFLEDHGFTVERGVAGLPTAFLARYEHHDREFMRKGARHADIGFIAEYDALPEIGHAHGHHLVSAAALATALSIKATFDAGEHGTINVIGTPGTFAHGKHQLSRAGIFAPLDGIIGAHPAESGKGFFHTADSAGNTLGSARATVTFSGDGNASRAAARLREAFAEATPSVRSEESVAIAQGDAPDDTVEFDVRAASRTRIVELLVDVKTLAQSAADETETEAGFTVTDVFDDMVVSRIIARRMNTYASNLGFKRDKPYKMPFGEPTEWGSVSYDTSTYQAFYPIVEADTDVRWGTEEFTRASNTDLAYQQTFGVAECMAFAALDLYRELDFRAMTDNQLVRALKQRGVERVYRRWTGLHRVLPKRSEGDGKRGPSLVDFKIVSGPGANESSTDSTELMSPN